MSLTPFTRELGTTQGRIRPALESPDQGDFVFVLGAEVRGRRAFVSNLDKIQIVQSATAAGTVFVRPQVRLRPPSTALPANSTWLFLMYLNGTAVVTVPVDRARDLTHLAMNYAALAPASGTIAFALQFATASHEALEVELPTVYLDSLVHDTTPDLAIVNRLPDDGETAVPRDSLIQLDISSADGGGIVLVDTKIWINDVLAFDGGTFQVGWNGGSSGYVTTLDASLTLRVTIDPTSNLPSEQITTIRVASRSGSGSVVTQSYSFQIEDYTPPDLIAAQAQKRNVVRVEFSEPMLASEALDPASWAITIASGPPIKWGDYRTGAAVWVNVASVAQVSDRLFDLTSDIDLTMNATYVATASGIHDLHGNLVNPSASSQSFVALDTRPPERNFQLVDHVPSMNIREDATQDLRKLLWAWQEPLDLILCKIDEWLDVLDPETAPEPFLDAMLADLGNPFTFPLTVNEKRRLIGLLIPIYQQRGTGEGIVNVIRLFLGLDVTLRYPGLGGAPLGTAIIGSTWTLGGSIFDHYGYSVVSPIFLTDDTREKVRAIAEYMQATNEHLVSIIEPGGPPSVVNHMVLGISQLNVNWKLH